jgi:rod shape determining protein RodA
MAVSRDAGMVVVYFFIFPRDAFTAGVKLRWFVERLAAAGGLITLLGNLFRTSFPIISKCGFWLCLTIISTAGQGLAANPQPFAIGSGRTLGQGLFQGTQTQKPV